MAKKKYGLDTRKWTREFRETLSSLEAFCGSAGFSAKAIAKDPSALFAVIKYVYGVETDETANFFQRVIASQILIKNIPRSDRRQRQERAKAEIITSGLKAFAQSAAKLRGPVVQYERPVDAPPLQNGTAVRADGRADNKRRFYKSWDWRTMRMAALKKHGAICQCCGAKRGDISMSGDPVKICVDHIKPLATHWHLRLEPENLQILCDECNMGKGAWDQTDWRDEGSILDDEPMTEIEIQLGQRMH